MDDLYIEYDELVEAGEIDPSEISAETWVQDRFEDMVCAACERND